MTHVEILHKKYEIGGYKAVLSAMDNYDYGSFTNSEIESILDLSPRQVKETTSNALRKLRSPKTLIPYLKYLAIDINE